MIRSESLKHGLCKRDIGFREKNFGKVYTLVFIVSAFLIFSLLLVTRRTLVAGSDVYNQCYPVYIYLGRYYRSVIRAFFTGQRAGTFDLSIGYGSDILTTLNYYGLGDPFSLTAILFSDVCPALGFSLTFLLRLYAAGGSFSLWAKEHGFHGWSRLLGAIYYAFSGYSLFWGVTFPSFLNLLIFIPVLFLLIDRILARRYTMNNQILFTIAVFLLALNNFYYIYILGIFCCIYLFTSAAVRKIPAAVILHSLLCLLVPVLLGTALSAFLFLPELKAYLSSGRTSESSFLRYLFTTYSSDIWLDRIHGLLAPIAAEKGLGCGILAVLAVLFILTKRKAKTEDSKILTVLLILFGIGYCLPGFSSVMNGFSYATLRWTCILYFLFAWAILTMIDSLKEVRCTHAVLLLLVFIVWSIAEFIRLGAAEITAAKLAAAALEAFLLFAAVLACKKDRITKDMFASACLFLVIFLGILDLFPTKLGGEGFSNMFKSIHELNDIENSLYTEYSETAKEETVYARTDICDTTYAASLINDSYGTTSYYSISNPYIIDFMNSLRVSEGIEGNSFVFRGLGERTGLESLLSCLYYAGRNADTSAPAEVKENEYYLPLGFCFDSYRTAEEDADRDPIDRNSDLLRSVVIDTGEGADLTSLSELGIAAAEQSSSDASLLPVSVRYENIAVSGDELKTEKDGRIYLTLEEPWDGTGELYVCFSDFCYLGDKALRDVSVNGQTIRLRPAGSFYGQEDDFMTKLSSYDGTGDIAISLPDDSVYTLGSISVYVLNTDHYAAEWEERSRYVLEDTVISRDSVSGNLTLDSPEILFMSIPYSDGWSCTIDGAEAVIYKADAAFLAVAVPAGEHTVSFLYRTPGLQAGILLSLLALLTLAIWVAVGLLIYKKRIKMYNASVICGHVSPRE